MYGLRYRSRTAVFAFVCLFLLVLVLLYVLARLSQPSLEQWLENRDVHTPMRMQIDRERSDVDCRLLAIPFRGSAGAERYARLLLGPSRDRLAYHFSEMGTLILTQPFHRIEEKVTRVQAPLISEDGEGWPDLVSVIHCAEQVPYLLYHRRYLHPERYGGSQEFGYMAVGVCEHDGEWLEYDPAAKRPFSMPADTAGWMRHEINLRFFGDLMPERPGKEVLYTVDHIHIDEGKTQHRLVMMAADTWRELWHLELAGSCTGLVKAEEGAWLCSCLPRGRNPLKLPEICCMWITWVRCNPCLVLQSASRARRFACLKCPARSRCCFLQMQSKQDHATCLASYYSIHDQCLGESVEVPATWEWLCCSDGRGSTAFYLVVSGHRLLRLNENLQLQEEASFDEPVRLLGCVHQRPRMLFGQLCSRDAVLLATARGNLLLVDRKMHLLAGSRLTNHLMQNQLRNAADSQAQLPRYVDANGPVWLLNLSDEVLELRIRGSWFLPMWASILLIALPLLMLLHYILVLTLRWRYFHTLSDVLFSTAPDGVLVLDDGLRLHSANHRFWHMLALPQDAVLYHLGQRSRVENILAESALKDLCGTLRANQTQEGTLEIVTEEGPRSWFYRIVPIQQRFLGGGLVLIVQDITHQLDGTKRMVWRVMSQSVAHKLKTPLQRLRLLAEGSLMFLLEKEPPQCEYVLRKQRKILEAARDIDQILQEFFEISERKVKLRPVNLGSIVDEAAKSYRDRYLEDVHVDLLVQNSAELPKVLGDRFQILTLLTNLLDNALKALQGEGQIRFEFFALQDTQGDWVRMICRDNGIGIEKEKIPLILHQHQSFFREGHGIGLAVVQSVVESHGGRILVQSEVGEGAAFMIDFPQATQATTVEEGE